MKITKRRRTVAVFMSVAATALTVASGAAASSDGQEPPGKTTICHRTSSATNPFVLITVSNSSLPAHYGNGDFPYVPGVDCDGGGLPT